MSNFSGPGKSCKPLGEKSPAALALRTKLQERDNLLISIVVTCSDDAFIGNFAACPGSTKAGRVSASCEETPREAQGWSRAAGFCCMARHTHKPHPCAARIFLVLIYSHIIVLEFSTYVVSFYCYHITVSLSYMHESSCVAVLKAAVCALRSNSKPQTWSSMRGPMAWGFYHN